MKKKKQTNPNSRNQKPVPSFTGPTEEPNDHASPTYPVLKPAPPASRGRRRQILPDDTPLTTEQIGQYLQMALFKAQEDPNYSRAMDEALDYIESTMSPEEAQEYRKSVEQRVFNQQQEFHRMQLLDESGNFLNPEIEDSWKSTQVDKNSTNNP